MCPAQLLGFGAVGAMEGTKGCQSKMRSPKTNILKRPAGSRGQSAASGGPIGNGGAAPKKPLSATLAAGSRNRNNARSETPKEKRGAGLW